MIINGSALLWKAPIKNMVGCKVREHGVSYGLGEAGYDIRIRQNIEFVKEQYPAGEEWVIRVDGLWAADGKFVIASAIEEFTMPTNLVAVVHDKSTWARKGLSIFNTVVEPGFEGGLTLELVYHGTDRLIIPAGAGIAQVLFSEIAETAKYDGKYQHQSVDPVEAIFEK